MLKIISVNIEHDKHLSKVRDFFDFEMPDVVCLQEVNENDVQQFASQLNGAAIFAPMLSHEMSDGSTSRSGIAIVSSRPVAAESEHYYTKDRNTLRHPGMPVQSAPMALLSMSIEKGGERFDVSTTHFLKTTLEGGFPDAFQFSQVEKLLEALDEREEVIVCGDFNAPRGMPIFSKLAQRYTDNVDLKYTRSLDPQLHKRPDLELMVDGLFTSPHYEVSNMRFQDGVSDHYAIVAEVSRHAMISELDRNDRSTRPTIQQYDSA